MSSSCDADRTGLTGLAITPSLLPLSRLLVQAYDGRAMVDHGHPLEFGISIVPYADALDRNRELVRVADDGGIALVGIQDHPYQRHFFDTWSLIPTLLAETKRVSFFTDVANLPLR